MDVDHEMTAPDVFESVQALPNMVTSIPPTPAPLPIDADQEMTAPDVFESVQARPNMVTSIPAPPPIDEPFESLPPSQLLSERYGFVAPTAQLDPPIPPSSPAEVSKMALALRLQPSYFQGLSSLELDAMVLFVDELTGMGPKGGTGIRDRQASASTSSGDLQVSASTSSIRGVGTDLSHHVSTSSFHGVSTGLSRRTKQKAKKHHRPNMSRTDGHTEGSDMIINPVCKVPLLPRIRSELWDVDANNVRNIIILARLLNVRKMTFVRGRNKEDTRPCYVLMLTEHSPPPWFLGFHSPTDLLHACRMPFDNSFDIASRLLRNGISFKTLVRLPPNWTPRAPNSSDERRRLPIPMETPYRLKDYTFTATDYTIHE
jgi:hypothetical protein